MDDGVLFTGITNRLKTVAGITVFDGHVPKAVPLEGDHVLPYAVLWAGIPTTNGEVNAQGKQDMDTGVLDFQVTVVASNAAACRAVARAVTMALANFQLGKGRIRNNPDAFQRDPPLLDTSVTPARFMLPTQWRHITN